LEATVIAAYVRSPFTFATKGQMADIRPDDLANQVVRVLLSKTDFDPALIEDLVMGCAYPEAEQGMNIANIISYLAGLGTRVPGITMNRFCGSSMAAVHYAAGQIAIGTGKAFICAGIESMSRVPQGGFNKSPNPTLMAEMPQVYTSMGRTAENVANLYKISREEQDAFAVESHRKATQAAEAGRYKDEIVPVSIGDRTVTVDGCIRPGTSMEALAKLKPAFIEGGSVTAGTSSPLTDGASALLVCSESIAQRMGLMPLARVVSCAVAPCPPEIMGIGPIPASRKALSRAGITAGQLDVVEINEAFASQAIACIRELGLPPAAINIDGGALAIGHPLGATGARLVGKAASLLVREKGRYALATQCIGGGQGIATVLESL
jgi:acetyl-CoA acyltransferase